MGIEIRFEVDEEQHRRLKAIKDKRGYTWKGLMLEGVEALNTDET
jgi:hypothetical protein